MLSPCWRWEVSAIDCSMRLTKSFPARNTIDLGQRTPVRCSFEVRQTRRAILSMRCEEQRRGHAACHIQSGKPGPAAEGRHAAGGEGGGAEAGARAPATPTSCACRRSTASTSRAGRRGSCSRSTGCWPGRDTPTTRARRPPDPRAAGAADVHNLVTLSRYPICARRELLHELVAPPLHRLMTAVPAVAEPQPVRFDRPILVTDIELPGGEALVVVNVHLRAPLAASVPGQKLEPFVWKSVGGWAEGTFLSALRRAGQALELRLLLEQLLDADAHRLIAVAGDFNAEDHEVPLRIVIGGRGGHRQRRAGGALAGAARPGHPRGPALERAAPWPARDARPHPGEPDAAWPVPLGRRPQRDAGRRAGRLRQAYALVRVLPRARRGGVLGIGMPAAGRILQPSGELVEPRQCGCGRPSTSVGRVGASLAGLTKSAVSASALTCVNSIVRGQR